MGIKEMFGALFATGSDVEYDVNVEFTPEQQKTLDSIEKNSVKVETPITEQPRVRRGLRKKYETPNIKAMDEKLEEMTEILKGKKIEEEKEIGE